MNPAGQIDIRLNWRAGVVLGVELVSSRPLHAQKLFIGKTPEQVLGMIPLLFNVCGIAQGYNAIETCRQALAMPPDSAARQARQMLVHMETVREHGWRILTDWPAFAGVAAEKPQWARLFALINEFKSALFVNGEAFKLNSTLKIDPFRLERGIAELDSLLNSQIFGDRLCEWRHIEDAAGLDTWLNDNSSVSARLLNKLITEGLAVAGQVRSTWLPSLKDSELHAILSGPKAKVFIETPIWQSQPCESGALNRQRRQPLLESLLLSYGNGLATRLVACLTELATIPLRLRQCLAELSDTAVTGSDSDDFAQDGIGLAQVEAARGLLIHRLTLQQGLVASYQIVAPTEWNFHPRGVVAQALSSLSVKNEDQLRQLAAMLISAIDPCVGYRLTIAADSVKMPAMVTGGKGHA